MVSGWHDEDAPRIEPAAGGPAAGAYAVAPDPARDARVAAYRDQQRRRAARALDRYMEVAFGAEGRVAGERLVEAVGDYVLSRLHHNGDYGVPPVGRPHRCATCGEWFETQHAVRDHHHESADPYTRLELDRDAIINHGPDEL